MKTISNTVLAQNVGPDIPLPESDHNFGIVHRQMSLSKGVSQNTKNLIFSENVTFVIKEYHCLF